MAARRLQVFEPHRSRPTRSGRPTLALSLRQSAIRLCFFRLLERMAGAAMAFGEARQKKSQAAGATKSSAGRSEILKLKKEKGGRRFAPAATVATQNETPLASLRHSQKFARARAQRFATSPVGNRSDGLWRVTMGLARWRSSRRAPCLAAVGAGIGFA